MDISNNDKMGGTVFLVLFVYGEEFNRFCFDQEWPMQSKM